MTTPWQEVKANALAALRAQHEREKLVLALLKQLEYLNLAHLFEREYRFTMARKWRLDLYASSHQLGIELHGGIFTGGRHTRGTGFSADRTKMNAAIECDIRVLEYPAEAVKDGSACLQIERILKGQGRAGQGRAGSKVSA